MRRMSAPFFFVEHVVRTHHIRPELLTWQCGRTGSQVPHPSMVVVSNSFDKDSLQALLVRFVSHRFTSGKDVAEDSGGKAPFHDRRLSYSLPAMRRKSWQRRNSVLLFTQLSLFRSARHRTCTVLSDENGDRGDHDMLAPGFKLHGIDVAVIQCTLDD